MRINVKLVSWSLTSLFSTNMAISETKNKCKNRPTDRQTDTHLMASLPRTSWVSWHQKDISHSSKRWWVAVASAGTYICKLFAPCCRQITKPAPHHLIFFTGRMLFLMPYQQCQSNNGCEQEKHADCYTACFFLFDNNCCCLISFIFYCILSVCLPCMHISLC